MESTGHYWLALWSHLDGNGWRLALVNPNQTIPGIGPVYAAVIGTELGDPDRFEDAKKAFAFASIDASRVQSQGE